ncbi:hypothetical protein Adt_27714 [Abeliophyllum distichum]|uniref:Uncharacterized protein n=1 Tax=Abeliophyllum distichum TaxID=126358 RepID=A0ABD1RUJ2_9LAMI
MNHDVSLIRDRYVRLFANSCSTKFLSRTASQLPRYGYGEVNMTTDPDFRDSKPDDIEESVESDGQLSWKKNPARGSSEGARMSIGKKQSFSPANSSKRKNLSSVQITQSINNLVNIRMKTAARATAAHTTILSIAQCINEINNMDEIQWDSHFHYFVLEFIK